MSLEGWSAAIRVNGEVVMGDMHFDCYLEAADRGLFQPNIEDAAELMALLERGDLETIDFGAVDGFWSEGRFFTRDETMDRIGLDLAEELLLAQRRDRFSHLQK